MRYIFEHKEIKSCIECPFSHDIGYGHCEYECQLLMTSVDEQLEKMCKHPDCPLRETKKHIIVRA